MKRAQQIAALLIGLALAGTAPAKERNPDAVEAVAPAAAETAVETVRNRATPASKGAAYVPPDAALPVGAGTGGGTVFEQEPNNSAVTATLGRDVPFTARGTVGAGDVDVYAVDVTAGQTLYASVAASRFFNSPLDAQILAIYADAEGAGQILGSNDDYAGGPDPELEFTVPVTTRVYIVVSSAVPGQGGPDYGYRLWLVPRFDVESEVEPNDGPGEADQIGLPGVYLSRIEQPGDADWLMFGAEAGSQLVVDVNGAEFGLPVDPVVELYDAAGNWLFRNDDVGTDPDSAFNIKIPATGNYFLRFSDYRSNAGGSTNAMLVSVSLQDGAASPTVTGVKQKPTGPVKRVLGTGFGAVADVEVDASSVPWAAVPAKPNVLKLKPAATASQGSVVTVVTTSGRRSNPLLL